MGILISLPTRTPRVGGETAGRETVGGSADILLFTGVRYERHVEVPAATPAPRTSTGQSGTRRRRRV